MPDVLRRSTALATALVVAGLAVGAIGPGPTAGHAIPGFERFLYALAQVESGGRYDARNPTSGAYGKYQIIPSSWRLWAREVLGNASAPMTPQNQEKVARYKIHQSWHRTGSWRLVAYWWLTGRVNRDPSTWSSTARRYVNKVMAIYDRSATGVSWSFNVPETHTAIAWSGPWAGARHAGYQGGAVRWSKQAGARASLTFTGKAIAWIGPRGPTRGQARIYIDGVYLGVVDLYARSFTARAVLWSRSWTSAARHTITIEVVGTARRPVVAIDAFAVAR